MVRRLILTFAAALVVLVGGLVTAILVVVADEDRPRSCGNGA
jgi:hypothetical protein